MSLARPDLLVLPLALEDDVLFLARLRRAQGPLPPLPERVHPTTLRVYLELPLAYRDADEQLGWPLLAWLSLLLDQAGEIVDTVDRIDITGDTDTAEVSELVAPDLADADWLPWLAQHVGVRPAGLSAAALRDAIKAATSGYRVGTKAAISDAARAALTGTQFVKVFDHSVANPGDGGAWDVLIVTRAEETASGAAVLAAVLAAGAKPAGVVLHQRSYSASWTAMTTAYPTWADRNSHRWLDLEEAGL